MDNSGLKKTQIDEIVLVGGRTRIPKVQQLLKECFDGKELNKGSNPDETVAYGAVVQGGTLSGEGGEETKNIPPFDVTPLTLGIETIPRNSVIPPRRARPSAPPKTDSPPSAFKCLRVSVPRRRTTTSLRRWVGATVGMEQGKVKGRGGARESFAKQRRATTGLKKAGKCKRQAKA